MERFFKIPAEIIFESDKGEEERLSPSAKLLLIYLICLNNSKGFTISLNGLKKLYGGHKDQLLAGMKELKRKGILITEQKKENGGRWGQTVYKINIEYFNRNTENRSTENRSTENRSTENRSTENRTHTLDNTTLDYNTLNCINIKENIFTSKNIKEKKEEEVTQTSILEKKPKEDTTMTKPTQEKKPKEDTTMTKTTQEKKAYGDDLEKHVMLTEAEYNTLVKRFGEEFTKKCIEKLNNYIGKNPATYHRKYKSDYRCILMWVVRAVKDDETSEMKNKFYKEKTKPKWGDSSMCQYDHSDDDDTEITGEELEEFRKTLPN